MDKIIEDFYNDNRLNLVKRFAFRAGSFENAEDIVQEAFCRALRYKDSFNEATQEFGAWFNTIINNALADFKKEELGRFSVEYEEDTESFELCQTSGDSFNKVLIEINAKEVDIRQVLFLYYIRDYRIKEVVDVVDMPYRTVQSIVTRFKADMLDKFGDDL